MSDSKVIQKRFSLTKEERIKVENIQSVMGILRLLQDGMSHSLTLALMSARVRLNIKDTDAPKGYTRNVGYDADKAELIVTDAPNPPEPSENPVVNASSDEISKTVH